MNPTRILPVCVAVALAVMVSPMTRAQSADQWGVPVMPTPGSVTGGAAPIENALARIIPAPYRIELDSAVPSATVLVWRSGDDWMAILRQAVAPMGLIVAPDWQTNTIRVLKKPSASRYADAIQPYSAAPQPATTMPASTGYMPAFGSVAPRVASYHPLPTAATTPPPAADAATARVATPAAPPAAVKVSSTSVLASTPVPLSSAQTGRQFTIAAGEHLSAGLTQYARTFGWSMRWQLAKDYILDAPLPIPAMSLKDGLRYVLQTYQSQGGLHGATFSLAEPNHIVVARPTAAMEDNQ